MKKIFALCLVASLVTLPLAAEKVYRLDDAIKTVAKGIATKLPEGAKVVVLNVKASKPEVGDYIVEDLTASLLEVGKLVLVDRQNLAAIREELSLQVSGDVSDESAQRLGAMLGAEVLISGSFDLVGEKYRMAIKAVQVETAQIRYVSTLSVASDADTEALFGNKTGSAKAASAVGSAARSVADFTGRFICSAVNPVLGIGSYMQGDLDGGGTVVFWELAGTGAIIWGSYREEHDQSNSQPLMVGGAIALSGVAIYAIIRPWTYNRSPKLAEALDGVSVSSTADNSLSLGYTIRY